MFRGRTLAGAVLCVLAFSALGVANASAAGMTAVECESVAAGTGLYTSSQCTTPKTAKSNFETVPFTESKAVSGETLGYPVILHVTLAGSKVTVTCTNSSVSGKVTNVMPGAEMQAHGTEGLVKVTGCTAHFIIEPLEVCDVESVSGTAGQKGVVETNKLTATTQADHLVKVKAETGNEIAKFKILNKPAGCMLPATTVTVTDTATATGNTGTHSFLTFSEPTGAGGEATLELKANGAVAALTTNYVGYTTAEQGKAPGDRKPVGLETF